MHPLKSYISQGEGVSLDFKKTISSAKKIAKTIVAFANTKGGKLLIGINDSGNITGSSVEEEEYMIESSANFFCNPPVEYQTKIYKYQSKSVLEVYIPESNEKPHAAKGEDGKWWVYIRVEDQTLLASKIVIEVLRRQTNYIDTFVEYSSKEKALLDYLNSNSRITLKEYCKLVNISKRRASRIMINLISLGVIKLHTTEKTEFYTL